MWNALVVERKREIATFPAVDLIIDEKKTGEVRIKMTCDSKDTPHFVKRGHIPCLPKSLTNDRSSVVDQCFGKFPTDKEVGDLNITVSKCIRTGLPSPVSYEKYQ